ncbi:hypothetical protein KGP17_23365 [Serratia sp. JSRIV001]|jgi:hypothetical protein|uniref:hypothetical protein n=1 Tax=Serratia sp. JSRIV001 TaxID=2831893 RepID=UPI001CBB6433|nr:hypothetical protein [Serratia sp. JSRIV001]UAN45283.1 hypothetical protein KGP17_23365 [Serratia sp. JSRIV001]
MPKIGYAYNDVADYWSAKVEAGNRLEFAFGNSGRRTITLQIGNEAQGIMPFCSFWIVVDSVSLIGQLASSMTRAAPNLPGSATAPTLPVKKGVTLPTSPLRTLFKRFCRWFGVAINLNDQIMNKQNNLINTQKLELTTKNYQL